ncbi:winged helix-turn-helix transcriptional regulator [Knoellia sp. CPCC 206453]|uniref:winged helix-turn-helix transcriptional regulator n=1 Tax=Knoellia pratensis TaxID=3404796 RepID=UPI0036101D90
MRTQLGDTLRVIGERSALMVIQEVSLGVRRFDELQVATGVPRAVLSDRLRRLTDAGILATRVYRVPGSRARSEYTMTPAGSDLLPVLAAISDWGARHRLTDGHEAIDGFGERDVDYRHVACGGHVTAVLVCECGQQITPEKNLVAQVNR